MLIKFAPEVLRIFDAHCAGCHAGRKGIAFGDFDFLYDESEMILQGLIVPGDPEKSRLYQLIIYDQMPPTTFGAVADPSDPTKAIGPVSAADREILAAWILAGAPFLGDSRPPLSLTAAQFRGILLDDLAALPPGERANYRYVGLYGQSAQGYTFPSYSTSSISHLLNRLSPSGDRVVRPPTVLGPGDHLVALRVDLRDYGLDAADWARIERATDLADRQAFPCDVPYLNAEDLLEVAGSDEVLRADGTLESVYSNIVLRRFLQAAGLLAPGQLVFEPAPAAGGPRQPLVSQVTLPELAGALGVDLAGDIARGGPGVMRACVSTSIETSGPRCAQRDAMGDTGRGFWWTMDVVSPGAVPLAAPIGPGNGGLAPAPGEGLGFDLNEGQAFWPWPNDVAGVATFDDQLRLRSSRPSTAAESFTEYSYRSDNGSSCSSLCHSRRMIAATDEALHLAGLPSSGYTDEQVEFVERLHRRQPEFDARLALDQSFYSEAASRSCFRGCSGTGGSEYDGFGFAYYRPSPLAIASALFLDEPSFRALVESSPGVSPALLAPEGVPRGTFLPSFQALRRAAIDAGADEAAL
ncbi:MAG TPA: c-type cytochrome domain-containing protein, partial [Polyangiaceae bacterium]|nr:c-type cytochrome domain-containing protein [Polyangiaceae bacterium]